MRDPLPAHIGFGKETLRRREVDTTYLKYVYRHDLIITGDEVPDIMKLYGKKN